MSAESHVVRTADAPQAIGPYSQAVVCGDQVWCSGQVALDPKTGLIAGADVPTQTQRVLDNLSAVLRAAGCTTDDVVRCTVFLKDLARFGEMNEVYGRTFKDRSEEHTS